MSPQQRSEFAQKIKQGLDQQFQQFCDKNSAAMIPTVMFMSQAGADQETIKSKIDPTNGNPGLRSFVSDFVDFLFRVNADDQDELLHASRDWCMNRISTRGGLKYFAKLMPQSDDTTELKKVLAIESALKQ